MSSPSPSPPPTSSSSSAAPPPIRRPRLCAPAPPQGLLASPPSKLRDAYAHNAHSPPADQLDSNSTNPQTPQVPLLRVYPFPPPTIPLTTPLTDPTNVDNCLRKRFLRRWRTRAPPPTSLAPASSPLNAPASRSKSRLAVHRHASSQNQSGTGRSPRNIYEHPSSPSVRRFSENGRLRPALDLVEGDPILPSYSAESSTRFARFAPSIRKTRRSQPSSRQRTELQNRIRKLRLQRRMLENSRNDEITAVASILRSHAVSRDDRAQLKDDMERLSPQGVRASVGLISRSLVAGLPHGKELKLRLDLLPADVIRELQVVVMQERNQLISATTAQLRNVCMELREAIREIDEKRCT